MQNAQAKTALPMFSLLNSHRYTPVFIKISGYFLLLLSFSIPIYVRISNPFFALAAFFIIISGDWKTKCNYFKHNPVIYLATAIILLHLIGITYSHATPGRSLHAVTKTLDFLCIGIFMSGILDSSTRLVDKIFTFFIAGSIVSFIVSMISINSPSTMSILIHFLNHHFSTNLPFEVTSLQVFPFSDYIVMGVFISFVLLVLLNRLEKQSKYHFFYIVCLICFTILLLWFSPGKTGYLLCAVVLALFWWGKTSPLKAIVSIAISLALGFFILQYSPTFHARYISTKHDVLTLQKDHNDTSIGQRLAFLKHSLVLWAHSPLIGWGAESFGTVYLSPPWLHQQSNWIGVSGVPADKKNSLTEPHNQYAKTAVEYGALGIIILIALFWAQWQSYKILTMPDRLFARGFVILIMFSFLCDAMFYIPETRRFYILFTAVFCAMVFRAKQSAVHLTSIVSNKS